VKAMLQEAVSMNPKGHVKVELYDEHGVFYTKEKKNLIVLDANSIFAEMMANPTKMIRISQKDEGNTDLTTNPEGTYTFRLSVQPEVKLTHTKDIPSTNTEKVIMMDGVDQITELLSVKVGTKVAVLNKDVFLRDAERGVIEFVTPPTEPITITYRKVKDPMVKIVEGTEVVKVGSETWTRGNAASDAAKTYVIDYKTGEVKFENTKINVTVTYDYHRKYCLGFMALGGKPQGHPDYMPVSFSNADKNKTDMPEEFDGSRVPILFPAEISEGKAEIDIFPTKPVEFVEKTVTITAADTNGDDVAEMVYSIDNSGAKVLKLVSVKNITTSTDLVIGTDVKLKDAQAGAIEFLSAPTVGDQFEVTYQLQSSNNHLTYQLTQAPVVFLESVVHEDIYGNKTSYVIKDRGLKVGQGDVWLLNPNAGIIQFSATPSTGVPVETPGQLTIQYRVNAGKVVRFIADFPKGVPGSALLTKTEQFTVNNGNTTFVLTHPVAKDTGGNYKVSTVTKNGQAVTYSLSADGTKVTVDNAVNGDVIEITYEYEKTTHEIYQVAMFDGKDKATSKMFNISGIGPITKDQNTGMRVTWSVTF
jgi:hypothetical protein